MNMKFIIVGGIIIISIYVGICIMMYKGFVCFLGTLVRLRISVVVELLERFTFCRRSSLKL